MPRSAAFLRVRFQEFINNAEEAPLNPLKNSREVSEAYENLAIAQFYSGNYHDCVDNFDHAYSLRKEYKQDRGNSRICLLAGLAYFRTSDLVTAESQFTTAIQAAESANAMDLLSMSKSNMAMLLLHKKEYQKAVQYATQALSIADEIMPNKQTNEYLDYVRVLIHAHLSAGDVTAAEKLIEKTKFSDPEAVLLTAGSSFAAGRPEAAKDVLLGYSRRSRTASSVMSKASSSSSLSPTRPTSASTTTSANTQERREYEDLLCEAMINYNLSAFSSKRRKFDETASYLQAAMAILKSAQEIAERVTLREDMDSGAGEREGVEVDVETVDAALLPKIMLSHMQIAQCENMLLGKDFNLSVDLQCGVPVEDMHEEEDFLQDLSFRLSHAITTLSSRNLIGFESIDNIIIQKMDSMTIEDSTELKTISEGDGSINSNKISSINSINSNKSNSINSNNMQHDSAGEDQGSVTGGVAGGGSAAVNNTTSSVAGSVSGIANRGAGGVEERPGGEGEKEQTPVDPKIFPENKDLMITRDLVEPYQHLLEVAMGDRDLVQSACKTALKKKFRQKFTTAGMIKKPNSSAINASTSSAASSPSVAVTPKVVSVMSTAVPATVRSEIFPLAQQLGSGELQYWLQWAFVVTHGVGLGVMGLPGFTDSEGRQASHSMEHFKEVKSKLLDLEEQLRQDDLSNKLVVYGALIKIGTQMNCKKEVGEKLVLFEETAERYFDPYYRVLAKRFRLDFEDWSEIVLPGMTATGKLRRLQGILNYAKQYQQATESIPDLQLQRDAMKRILNLFTEINLVPDPGTPGTEAATQQELDSMSEEDIDFKESTDIYWMRRFAKLRSVEYLYRMKAIRPKKFSMGDEDTSIYSLQKSLSNDTINRIDTSNAAEVVSPEVADDATECSELEDDEVMEDRGVTLPSEANAEEA